MINNKPILNTHLYNNTMSFCLVGFVFVDPLNQPTFQMEYRQSFSTNTKQRVPINYIGFFQILRMKKFH